MATGVLHDDLMLQILVRLPVKSLLRFRCVSRSWYSLITSSEFISTHVFYNKKISNYRVLLRRLDYNASKVWYQLCSDNEALDELMIINFPYVSQSNDFFRMVGCLNGLVCLSDDVITETDRLMLWNPVIRKILPLSTPKMDLDPSNLGQSVFGFGFDSLSCDYKVIRIQYPKMQGSKHILFEPLTAIFRLSTGCWEVKESTASLPFIDSRQAYVNGVIHWLDYTNSISGFDVRTEEFKRLMIPKSLQTSSIKNLTIAPWCDLLSIFENGYWSGRVTLWVMNDYGVQESWVKQFVVESFAIVRCLRSNGNIVLQNNASKLILYNPKTKQIKDFDTHIEGSSRGFHVKTYMESLVLLNHMDAKCVL